MIAIGNAVRAINGQDGDRWAAKPAKVDSISKNGLKSIVRAAQLTILLQPPSQAMPDIIPNKPAGTIATAAMIPIARQA